MRSPYETVGYASPMNLSSTSKRLTIAAYLGTTAFVIAHAINAFVAEALYVPLNYSAPSADAVESVNTQDSPRESTDIILHSGLFSVPEVMSSQSGQSSEPPPPPMNVMKKVMLLGTVFDRGAGVMAVLEDISTKKQDLYRLGRQVPTVGILATIEKNRVLFREGKSEEWLNLTVEPQVRSGAPGYPPPVGPRTPPSPQRRVLDRREVSDALADTTRLLTQAQAVPYLKEGKLDGFRLFNVMPMGFFDKIGLQANDIVQRINGVELRDPGMLLSLFQQLKTERTVRVDLVRDTQRQTLTYEIR